MIKLTINGQEVSVESGTTVYQAAKKLGIDIPVFCYQDRMPPFGACRICLVEVEKMGKLQASCTLEAKEGMVVNTQSAHAIDGRESIIEFLLLSHPLDCPVCDKGGECPLQEHALNHGPGKSRFFEEKRHFVKPLPLGPVLMLDRERCIICARCTRFGDEIAGDHALEFIDRGFRTEVGTPGGKPVESKFIGNTIKICPVGALTSQVYRFRARPWDNQPTQTTCTLCPVGCSMILDARDGEIMRTRACENKKVNDMWLCDKGWFGYEFSYSPDRLKTPYIRKKAATWEEAFSLIAEQLKQAKHVAGWGGNPLTTEENFLFQQLLKNGDLDHFGDTPSGMQTEMEACETLDYAYLLGLDLTEEFPVLWLRLRQAINKGAKVIFIGHFLPEIARHLSQNILHSPGKELEFIRSHLKPQEGKGAIFVGRQYLNTYNKPDIIQALTELNIPLNFMQGSQNSRGAAFAGMRRGKRASQVTDLDFLYIAGCNPDPSIRKKVKFLVVQDLFMTPVAQEADVVLPTLGFVEKGGSFINIEGRIQKLLPGKEIPEGILSDGDIFKELGKRLNIPFETLNLDQEKIPFELKIEGTSQPLPEGRLRATFCKMLFDHGVRMEHNPHLLKLVKEPKVRLHPDEARKLNLTEGQKVTIPNVFSATLQLDTGVAEGTVVIPHLAEGLINGMPVEIES